MAGSGVRRSEEMVMGSAKRAALDVKSAKAVWRSSEAGGLCELLGFQVCHRLYMDTCLGDQGVGGGKCTCNAGLHRERVSRRFLVELDRELSVRLVTVLCSLVSSSCSHCCSCNGVIPYVEDLEVPLSANVVCPRPCAWRETRKVKNYIVLTRHYSSSSSGHFLQPALPFIIFYLSAKHF